MQKITFSRRTTMKFGTLTLFICFFTVLFCAPIVSSTMIEVGGGIITDTTWTNDDTIRVISSIAVITDVRLTIQSGTVILFNPATNIQVQGELYAEGAEGDEIVFTSIYDTTGGYPSPGNWPGLYFHENSHGVLRHCINRWATYGFLTTSATVEFYDCISECFSVYGFYLNGVLAGSDAPVKMERCVARQEEPALIGRGTGINVYQKTDVHISRCKIYGCKIGIDFNAHSFAYPTFDIAYCDIHDNLIYGIFLESCG